MAVRRSGALKQDSFANIAHIQCVESAANTLTYKKLETGISLFEKVAWVISRIEYIVTTTGLFGANVDELRCAVATSDNPTTISPDEAAFVDMIRLFRTDFGTAGNGLLIDESYVKDFWGLPGGGLIVPPNPMYLAVSGVNQPAAATVDVRIFYIAKTLKAEEYWELVEARRIISST